MKGIKPLLGILIVTTPLAMEVNGQIVSNLVVDAQADIFAAGLVAPPALLTHDGRPGGGGILPPAVVLAPGIRSVAFNASGSVAFTTQTSTNGPDGSSGNTDISSYGGISGIVADRRFFLTGVFLAATGQPSSPPAALDFSTGAPGTDFLNLSPSLGQLFFIGDGLAGAGSGDVQKFIVPPGATTLFLGFADAPDFSGTPGTYDDNSGSLTVAVTQFWSNR